MKELRFKNGRIEALCCAYVCTVAILFFCAVFICAVYIGKEEHDVKAWLIGFGIALSAVWLLAGLAIILSKTVVITADEIKLCRGKKVKWCLKKEEIGECIYNGIKWYELLFPSSAIMETLRFRLQKTGKISIRRSCSLTQKQINKIKVTFDYPIIEINKNSGQK